MLYRAYSLLLNLDPLNKFLFYLLYLNLQGLCKFVMVACRGVGNTSEISLMYLVDILQPLRNIPIEKT